MHWPLVGGLYVFATASAEVKSAFVTRVCGLRAPLEATSL